MTIDTIEGWATQAGERVSYCASCQPRDEGEFEWFFGVRCSLDELMDDLGVPEKYREEVALRITCRFCGRAGFDRWDDYGEKSPEELAADARWEKWWQQYHSRVEDFAKHLERHPYLGGEHPIGQEILSSVGSFPEAESLREDWWRARRPLDARIPDESDMSPPAPGEAWAEGRFSHYGQSVFYLAGSQQAALAEVLDPLRGEAVAWVQGFTVTRPGRILDFRGDISLAENPSVPVLALGLVSSHLPNLTAPSDSAWKPEYFVPRFIADAARHRGFDGIVFSSRKHYDENLVLFRWDSDTVSVAGEPQIVRLAQRESWDGSEGDLPF